MKSIFRSIEFITGDIFSLFNIGCNGVTNANFETTLAIATLFSNGLVLLAVPAAALRGHKASTSLRRSMLKYIFM